MQKVFKKALWKDILIAVILIGITFLRFTTFKQINWFYVAYYTLALIAAGFAAIYTLISCKTRKERKWLVCLYSLSLLFLFHKDAFEVFIYLVVAAIFIENRDVFIRVYFVLDFIFFINSLRKFLIIYAKNYLLLF